jgi:hypothetical protein
VVHGRVWARRTPVGLRVPPGAGMPVRPPVMRRLTKPREKSIAVV